MSSPEQIGRTGHAYVEILIYFFPLFHKVMVGSDVSPASSHYKEERHLNGPEIRLLAENDLRRAILRQGTPRDFEPIRGTPWVAMSLLQKALRRGQLDFALRAAASLLQDAPDRLWRRRRL